MSLKMKLTKKQVPCITIEIDTVTIIIARFNY